MNAKFSPIEKSADHSFILSPKMPNWICIKSLNIHRLVPSIHLTLLKKNSKWSKFSWENRQKCWAERKKKASYFEFSASMQLTVTITVTCYCIYICRLHFAQFNFCISLSSFRNFRVLFACIMMFVQTDKSLGESNIYYFQAESPEPFFEFFIVLIAILVIVSIVSVVIIVVVLVVYNFGVLCESLLRWNNLFPAVVIVQISLLPESFIARDENEIRWSN